MYYLVNVDRNSTAARLTRSNYEGYYKVLYMGWACGAYG